MTDGPRRGFAERPRAAVPSADAWVRAEEPAAAPGAAVVPAPDPSRADLYPARLTIDVTKALRARIKIAAFARGMTVADMMRDLLEAQFPEDPVGATGTAIGHGAEPRR